MPHHPLILSVLQFLLMTASFGAVFGLIEIAASGAWKLAAQIVAFLVFSVIGDRMLEGSNTNVHEAISPKRFSIKRVLIGVLVWSVGGTVMIVTMWLVRTW